MATPNPESAPVRLGHHVLLHRLGAGGMGVVYAAYDERLDRRVAIKLLRTHKRDKARRRLIREAQALARLSHPNVVQIYEIGEYENQPFLVMELIDGVTLGPWRREQARTRAEILAVFIAAGRGLAAAHAQGLIHRDFKPDNVMIRRDGRVVVMDFGLAREDERADSPPIDERHWLDSGEARVGESHDSLGHGPPSSLIESISFAGSRSSELQQPLTMAGAVIGTPGYMAPEQLVGGPVHDRCDQFSFCASLWEALYDRRPFAGGSVSAYARSIRRGKLEAPEPNTVPAWLRKVIERGLARDPADRWPSMNDLLDALQRDPTRRRRLGLAVGGALVLGLAIVAGLWLLDSRERERAANERAQRIAACEGEGQAITSDWNPQVADRIERAFLATNSNGASSAWQHTRPWLDGYAREWAALRTQVCVEVTVEHSRNEDSHAAVVDCLDEGRIGLLGVIETLAGLTPQDGPLLSSTTVTAASLPSPAHCFNEALLRHRQPTPMEMRDEITALRVQLERAKARNNVGDYQRALSEAESVLDRAQALGWGPLIAAAGLTVGGTQSRLGNHEDSRRAMQQAYWAAAASGDNLGMLLAASDLGFVLAGHLSRLEEGRGWATLGKALVERFEVFDTIYEADMLDWLGPTLRNVGEYVEAMSYHRRAVEIYERVLGPAHPKLGIALINLGMTYSEMKESQSALDCYHRAQEILEATLGPEHADLGHVHSNIGIELHSSGDAEAGLASHQRALEIWKAAHGDEHFYVVMQQNNVGVLLCSKGECDEALVLYRRALEVLERKLGPEHEATGATHQFIALALQQQGADAEALDHFRRALAIFEASGGPEYFRVAVVEIGIGALLREQGQIEQALALIVPALARLESFPLDYRAGLLEHGLTLLEHGEIEAARAQLERAMKLFEQDRVGVPLEYARFAYARALWAAGEHARARELLDSARAGFVAAGAFGTRDLAKLDAWLLEHP